eukprot:snap_masked-scaffold_47-processed-gene-1.49-mRNA-1 protein AED:1.00 eAED:1.00 QI:0/0/0/0/1/1/2/0/361
MKLGDLILAFCTGLMLPIQATISAGLLEPFNNIMAPGFVSFVIAVLFLNFVFPFKPDDKKFIKFDHPKNYINKETIELFGQTPKYLFIIPGFMGGVYVAFSTFIGDTIGYSLYFVALICGQMLSSLLADSIGFMGIQKLLPTKFRLTAVFIVLIGSVLSVVDRLTSSLEELDMEPLKLVGYVILSVGTGLIFGLQPPMNNRLRNSMKTYPHRITWYGSIAAAVWLIPFVAGYTLISGEELNTKNLDEVAWWKWTGGPIGTLFPFATPRIGMGVFLTVTIAGQLICSLFIDTFGLLEAQTVDLTASRVIGVMIVYIAVVMFRFEAQIKEKFGLEEKKEEEEKEVIREESVGSSNSCKSIEIA